MALTKISTGGVKDDAASQAIIADEAVDEARLQISNAGSNGQFLQKQSGNTGGLTWAAANEYTHPNHSGEVTSSADGAQTIASNVVDEDNLKISNAGTNGQFLQKQSGNTGGLTWADVSAAPEVSLTADGTIGNNVACNIKSNGKVEAVTEVAAGANHVAASTGVGADYVVSTYDREHNKVVTFFRQSNDLKCVVGTPSGSGSTSTFTWGSVIDLHTSHTTYAYLNAEYIWFNDTNRHLLAWFDMTGSTEILYTMVVKLNSNGTVTVGAANQVVSGIDTKTPEIVNGHESGYPYLLFFVSGSGDTALQSRDGSINTADNSNSCAGGGASTSTETAWKDPIYAFKYLDRNTVMAKTGAGQWHYNTRIAGGWKTSTTFGGTSITRLQMFYDTTAAKVFAFYLESGTLKWKSGAPSTASSGGGIPTWSSSTDIRTTVSGWYNQQQMVVYDTKNSKYWLMFSEDSPAQKTFLYGFTISSAGAITWDSSPKEIANGQKTVHQAFYETSLGNVVGVSTHDHYTSYSADSTMDTSNFLGWSSAAYSDGDTATIKVVGNTVTGLSGLTPGKKYYVQRDGSVGLTPVSGISVEAGVALTSSSLLIK